MNKQEKANKKEARKLINLPLNQRPENVKYTPGKRLEFAHYEVFFGQIAVCFQTDGNRIWYLGEFPAANFR